MIMDNVTFIEIEDVTTALISTHAIIDHGNETFTSMPKATYEATLASELAPIPNPNS
jgi:hypothetical protein